jgi:hypothetical protein
MNKAPWLIMVGLFFLFGGGGVLKTFVADFPIIIALLVIGVLAFGILVFGKGLNYNAIGNGAQVHHVTHIEHHFHDDGDTPEISMDEETRRWLKP